METQSLTLQNATVAEEKNLSQTRIRHPAESYWLREDKGGCCGVGGHTYTIFDNELQKSSLEEGILEELFSIILGQSEPLFPKNPERKCSSSCRH